MAVARTREKGRGRRWERRRGAPRFCRAAPGCALRRFFDPQRSRKSLLEVRCECPGPPKMYIDVLGSWDTGGRRLTINSGFSYYPSTPDFAFRAAILRSIASGHYKNRSRCVACFALRDVESRSRALVEDLGTPVTVGLLRMQSAAEGEAKGPRPPADTRLTSPVTPP